MRLDTITRFMFLKHLAFDGLVERGASGATYRLRKITKFEVCPHCASKCFGVYDHRKVKIKDEPFRGKHVWLLIIKRRFSCLTCAKVFTEAVAGIAKGSRTTERYKRAILWAAERFSDFSAVRKAYRCSIGYLYKTVYTMLERERKRKLNYPWPTTIGLDEHSFRRYEKGKIRFVTSVVDISNDRLFEVVDGKDGLALKAALSAIPGRGNVERVVIDLAEHYRSFAKSFFPKARLTADEFHVVRLFSRLLNRKRIEKTGIVRGHPIRSLLLRNREDLTKDEKRELWQWLGGHSDVCELYQYKESIRTFYRTRPPRLARRLFIDLVDRMGKSKQAGVNTLRKTLLGWRSEILAFHQGRLTNAMAEGFNRKAKLVQRRAFGYRSFKNYRLRLLNACV